MVPARLSTGFPGEWGRGVLLGAPGCERTPGRFRATLLGASQAVSTRTPRPAEGPWQGWEHLAAICRPEIPPRQDQGRA